MEWKKYNRLPKKLKEEYNYRFKDKFNLNIGGLLLLLSVFMLTVLATLAMFYIIINEEGLAEQQDEMINQMQVFASTVSLGTYIIIAYLVLDILRILIKTISLFIWFRKNKVSILPMFVLKKLGRPLIIKDDRY